MSLHQICDGCNCGQHLIQCQIFLMAIFCSLLSKYSNNLIYFLLVNWSNFLSHLNSCPGDLPNNDSHEWNESCLWDSRGTSNWHNTVITAQIFLMLLLKTTWTLEGRTTAIRCTVKFNLNLPGSLWFFQVLGNFLFISLYLFLWLLLDSYRY